MNARLRSSVWKKLEAASGDISAGDRLRSGPAAEHDADVDDVEEVEALDAVEDVEVLCVRCGWEGSEASVWVVGG